MASCPATGLPATNGQQKFAASSQPRPGPSPAHLGVVCIRVEHDDGVGQHVRHVSALEGLWVAAHKALGKLLHEAIDLLGLARQAEARQELPEGAGAGAGAAQAATAGAQR
jgi:hypothetical protein